MHSRPMAGRLNRLAATSEPSPAYRSNSFPRGRQPAFSRLCKARVAERPRAPLAACPRFIGPAARRTGPQEAGSSPCRQSFTHRDGDAEAHPQPGDAPSSETPPTQKPPELGTPRAQNAPSSERPELRTLRTQSESLERGERCLNRLMPGPPNGRGSTPVSGAPRVPINEKTPPIAGLSPSTPRARLELATLRLTAGCSTIELPRNAHSPVYRTRAEANQAGGLCPGGLSVWRRMMGPASS